MLKRKRHTKGLHVGAAEGKLILAESGVKVVGVRLELDTTKAAFDRYTYEDIKQFYSELEKIDGINYATIRFNDGTGIFFVCGMTCCPEYGRVDRDGCIVGFPIGYVSDMGFYFVLTDDKDRPLTDGKIRKGINGIRESLDRINYVHDNCETAKKERLHMVM